MKHTLNKNVPGSANVGDQVAILFCHMCYQRRVFELIDEHPDSPRFSVQCEDCGFIISGSECEIRQHGHVEVERKYGEPHLTDEVYAKGAAEWDAVRDQVT